MEEYEAGGRQKGRARSQPPLQGHTPRDPTSLPWVHLQEVPPAPRTPGLGPWPLGDTYPSPAVLLSGSLAWLRLGVKVISTSPSQKAAFVPCPGTGERSALGHLPAHCTCFISFLKRHSSRVGRGGACLSYALVKTTGVSNGALGWPFCLL